MKTPSLVAFSILLTVASPAPLRAEVVDLTTTWGRTYRQCRVLKIELDGVSFRHSSGTAKVLFRDLTKNWRDHYGYDPEKARAHEAKIKSDHAKAREAAAEQARTVARARAEAVSRAEEQQVLAALRMSLSQTGSPYAWTTFATDLFGTTPESYQPLLTRLCRSYPQALSNAGWRQGPMPFYNHGNGYGSRTWGSLGCTPPATTTSNGYTPVPFFAVPGIGINATPSTTVATPGGFARGPVVHSGGHR